MRISSCMALVLTHLALSLTVVVAPNSALAQDEPAAAASAAASAAAASQPASSHPRPPEVSTAAAETCLRELGGGASLDRIRQAALEYAMVSPTKVAAALRSARMRGLYPTVHVLGLYRNTSHEQEEQFKDMLYRSQYESGNWPYKDQILTDGSGHGVFAGLLLKFDFSTLAGGRESLEALKASRLRTEVIEKITALYFKRQRLQIRFCSSTAPLGQRLLLKSRIDEVTAMLMGLAGLNKPTVSASPSKDEPRRPSTGEPALRTDL
jgi:hypothetical protein